MGLIESDGRGLRNSIPPLLLTAICAGVLSAILVAGLWPFHAPKNEVSWLNNGNGLRFGDHGSIVSAGALRTNESKEETPCSLEIWLQPVQVDYSGTILAFYRPDNLTESFVLHQSLGDLAIRSPSLDRFQHKRRTKIYVDDLFSHVKSVFVTISSGPAGTAVYADGSLVKQSANFRFSSQDLTGQFTIGNAPATTDTWSGQLKGFAIYNRELTASQVTQHYQSWLGSGHPGVSAPDRAVALYLFNEGSGDVVHNQVESATDLVIPKHFFVLHEPFLERPWNEYRPGWSYWQDIGINIAGFIPLGFVFYAYSLLVRKLEHPATFTIAFGFAVSLTIEVLQAFLPTRNSGTTDLITNTFGMAMGVMLCAWSIKRNWFAHIGISVISATGERREDLQLVD
jgi:VanZ like family/Concanavalin A-like lectin/glucanases superfamily